MSTEPLKHLTLEHLRGATVPFTLTFEKGKKLTVVYGENGTGKSTLCDGLELLGRGAISSLEGKGLGQTLPFWASIGKNASDISVTLASTTKACSAKITKKQVVVDPPAERPVVEVLRRNQLLRLIETEPAKRYAEIQRFVDISPIETCEYSLRTLIRNLEESRAIAVARVDENQTALAEFWKQAGSPLPNALTWAATESARDQSQLDADISAFSKLIKAFTELRAGVDTVRQAQARVIPSGNALTDAQAAVKIAAAAVVDGASDLVDILTATTRYLQKHTKPAVCPVCESAEKVADLSERTKARIDQFSALTSAKAALVKAERDAESANTGVEVAQKTLVEKIQLYAAAVAAAPSKVSPPAAPQSTDPAALDTWATSTADYLPILTQCQTELSDQKRFRSLLKNALKVCKENTDEQHRLDKLLPRLKLALSACEEERRKFTDGILTGISDEVGRIYEKMHPGEGLSKITFQLAAAKRASLEIGSKCYGQENAPPQAFFSESHVDTLGLCLFLALAKKEKPAETILVLDDVLASVDEPHVDRVIETLYEEATHFRHCLITTHYRPWKQKLRWGWLKNGHCQFVELTKWSNQRGIALIGSVPDTVRLRTLLAEAPPDPQLVCAKAGVILEAALDFLTQIYECKVPRRVGGLYTLGDLLPAIDKKLRNALQVEILEKNATGAATYRTASLTPLLEELIRIAQARNVFGCHFNALSFELLDSDAIQFGQTVLTLIETLACPEAGWPKNNKSGSYWANSGETRRLHPLQQPT